MLGKTENSFPPEIVNKQQEAKIRKERKILLTCRNEMRDLKINRA